MINGQHSRSCISRNKKNKTYQIPFIVCIVLLGVLGSRNNLYIHCVIISKTYRIIASLLCFSILIGVSIPVGLHAKSAEACNEAEDMHIGHEMPSSMQGHEDCPMEEEHRTAKTHDSVMKTEMGMIDLGFACACSLEEAPVKTEAPVMQKTKTLVLTVIQVLKEDHMNQTEPDNYAILTSDSYSPPPIFLANESFLI